MRKSNSWIWKCEELNMSGYKNSRNEKFKKVNSELKTIKDGIENKLNQYEARLTKIEKERVGPEFESMIASVVENKLPTAVQSKGDEETTLIDKKKNNLIYFRIPESDSEEIEQRIKHDFESIVNLYAPETVTPNEISNIFRVGKKSDNARPLVKFSDQIVKKKYVERTFGKKLSLKVGNEIIGIPATHDKTNKQREEYKKLGTELQRRQDAGEEDIGIRNNQIVQNFQKTQRGTKKTWANIAMELL